MQTLFPVPSKPDPRSAQLRFVSSADNLHELWAQLNFLLPDVFASAQKFDEWFQIDSESQKDEVVKQLHRLLRPFLLRRLKAEVVLLLPVRSRDVATEQLAEV